MLSNQLPPLITSAVKATSRYDDGYPVERESSTAKPLSTNANKPTKHLEVLKRIYGEKRIKQLGLIPCESCAIRTADQSLVDDITTDDDKAENGHPTECICSECGKHYLEGAMSFRNVVQNRLPNESPYLHIPMEELKGAYLDIAI